MICGINPVCDEATSYCISGLCIDKNVIYYGIAGIIALIMIYKGTSKK